MRLCLSIAALLCAGAVQVCAADRAVPTFALESKWTAAGLGHETSAEGIYADAQYIYVASTRKPPVNAKVKLDNGEVCWTHPAEGFQPSYPVSNGHVVVYGTYSKPGLVVLDDQTGNVLREIPTKHSVRAAPAFSGDLVFASSDDHNIYAAEWSTGTLRWKAALGAGSSSRPLVMGDQIVAGCDDGYLYFIDSESGNVKRKVDCTGVIWRGPVLANKLLFVVAGTLPIGRPGHKLSPQEDSELVKRARSRMLVIDPADGRIVSEFKTDRGCEFAGRVLVSGDRAFFFDYRTLYCYDTKLHKLVWQLDAPNVYPSPVLAGEYILLPMNPSGIEGQHQHKLVVVDPADGKILRQQESGGEGVSLFDCYTQCGDTVILTQTMQAFEVRGFLPITDSAIKEDWEKEKWVAECLAKMSTIRPGMTRTELMQVVTLPGGFVIGPNRTFEYQGCRYFKVDVTFKSPAHDEQGRVIQKPDDVIESISKPYLGEIHYR